LITGFYWNPGSGPNPSARDKQGAIAETRALRWDALGCGVQLHDQNDSSD
jgi:hypothetical protein